MKALAVCTAATMMIIWPASSANADHGGPTFEHECTNGPQGNPNGDWCLWTNPHNGLRYVITSEYEYRNGLPYYKGHHE